MTAACKPAWSQASVPGKLRKQCISVVKGLIRRSAAVQARDRTWCMTNNLSVMENGWLAPLYNMKSLRLLRCRGIYHVNTAVFAGHPYLRVFDSEFSTWQAPPLLGDEEDD